MDRESFWQIVETARAEVDDTVEDADEVADAVVDSLIELSLAEIVGFELELDKLQQESYRWDLWAAAYLINGGCSDDSFDYFRGWLLAQGREVWDAALVDPDSLASVVNPDPTEVRAECEDMLDAAATAYEQVTGDDEGFWLALDAAAEAQPEVEDSDRPKGENFDFDDPDEMRERLPLLSALFLDPDDDLEEL